MKYDRIDVSEEIDVNKSNSSVELVICHYWYILETEFRFQSKVWDVCYDLMEKALNYNDVAVVYVKGNP